MSIKSLILIPTYNEIENIELILARIRTLDLGADLLFVDDHSPDGTGKALDHLAAQDPHLHVMHRPGKLGVGSAHLDGIRWAYDQGVETLITLDADQTHSPEDVFRFLDALKEADIVVGSRFNEPDSLIDWSYFRTFLTTVGHKLTSLLLGMPYDATGAFRVYRLNAIPRGIFDLVQSKGYSFFYESLHLLFVNGMRIREVNIQLPARTYGHSKMRASDIIHSVTFLGTLALRYRTARSRLIYAKPYDAPSGPPDADRDAWDAYWKSQGYAGKILYDMIAAFYRRFIIRPAVNHFLSKTFTPGSHLLHAGCGSGAVDVDIARRMRITALDISSAGLTEYRRNHPGHDDLVLGSIFEIPAANRTYDGIFNLGVMEHFHLPQLPLIFREFNRVLKPGGRIVLYWPPAWGVTVNVLDSAHFVLNRVLGRNVKLHPDEHTRITSRAQTQGWLDDAGFEMTKFYFGPRDLFTHQIIIAEKIRDIQNDASLPREIGAIELERK